MEEFEGAYAMLGILQGNFSFGCRGAITVEGKESVVVIGCPKKISSDHGGNRGRVSVIE